MNITGNTSTCVITANTPFIQSGETSGNADSITITDENGMSVTSCFGLSTTITEFDISSGETCGNVLEIKITEGVVDELICDFTGTTLQPDGLILVTYSDGSTSLNVHPECCTTIESSYTPEIGDAGYYVCRWRELFDATDCNNYEESNTFEGDYMIFSISTGGTTTIVPSAECCYNIGLVDELTNVGVKCKEVVVPVCAEYVVEDNIPEIGDVEFTILSTGLTTFEVPTLECCTVNGLSGRELSNSKWTCYNNAMTKPRVSITLDTDCCEEIPIVVEPETGICEAYGVDLDGQGGNGGELDIINCAGYEQTIVISPQIQATEFVCMQRLIEARGDIIVQTRPSASCEDGSSNNCFSYDVSIYLGYCQVTWVNCDGTTGNGSLDGTGQEGTSDTDSLYIPCAKENTVQIIGFNGQAGPPTVTKGNDCTPSDCFRYDYGGTGSGTLNYVDCDGIPRTASFSGDGASGQDYNGEFCAKEITGYVNYLIYKGTC